MSNRIFTSKDVNGNEVVLRFNKPSQKVLSDGDFVYRQHFSKALRNGILTNAEAFKIMKTNGIWTDEHEKEVEDLRGKIKELETSFENPGLSNDEGLKLVDQIKELRLKLNELNSQYTSITDNTAENIANEYRLQFFAANCVVYNDNGRKVFKDLEDFISRGLEKITSDSYREALIANFEQIIGVSLSSDLNSELAENKWLSSRKLNEPSELEETNVESETGTKTELSEPKKRGRKPKVS